MNISISFGGDFSKSIVKKKGFSNKITSSNIGNNKKMEFYEDLLFNLKKEEIFIQSAEIDEDGALRAAISSSKIRSPIIKHSLTGKYATEIAINKGLKINSVESVFINVGTELSSIKTDSKYFNENIPSSIEEAITTSEIFSGKKTQYQRHEFRPIVKFPSFFYGITPALVNHIGDPSQFYYGGIVLRMDSELQLSRRLQINSQINLNMFNNFDEKSNNPDSDLPHVRTDIVQYLQNSEFYIPKLQLDFFNSISKNLFTKFSAGLLEDMYGGFGFEILYKPFYSDLSIGIEAYKVKKRGFKRDFKFLDYETTTGHLNLNYHHPDSKILATLSLGTYLAGDNGYTFDISRRLDSGFRAGVFFTRTNVSAELFGEGSFDKGFYFQIPIDLFLNDYRGGYMNFRLTPLTRDGGQKLQQGNDLIGIIHDSSYDEVNRDWPAFIQFWE